LRCHNGVAGASRNILIFLVVIDLKPAINDDNDFGFIRWDGETTRRGERPFAPTGFIGVRTGLIANNRDDGKMIGNGDRFIISIQDLLILGGMASTLPSG
jgi:hypothetical protein